MTTVLVFRAWQLLVATIAFKRIPVAGFALGAKERLLINTKVLLPSKPEDSMAS